METLSLSLSSVFPLHFSKVDGLRDRSCWSHVLRLDPEPWSQNLKEALSLESSKSDEIVKQKHKAKSQFQAEIWKPIGEQQYVVYM